MAQVGLAGEFGRAGSNLDVANAIRDYLSKANGDARLALALSVADSLAVSQAARGAGLRGGEAALARAARIGSRAAAAHHC